MIFTTLDFLLFFMIYNIGAIFLRKTCTPRFVYLTLASFVFYGWWDWRFLLLIIFSGLIDYFAAFFMSGKHRKTALLLSLLGNLGSLSIFKYSDFFSENINVLLNLVSLQVSIPEFQLILPVGISFYTFQSMSYTIDVYRGKLKPVHSIWLFFSYLSMFPQLVAGPIVRASEILEQIKKPNSVDGEVIYQGLKLIVWGLFLKMVVADTLGPIVDRSFSSDLSGDMWHWWMIITMFGIQIYCDFNGYSLIAIGIAKWMGFTFLDNFNHPYIACSFKDFWARWHISLSTWFRDYVYIPLGGNKVSPTRKYLVLWTTMLLSGLWHGASWNFIIWGGLHSLYLSLERAIGWNPQAKIGKMIAPVFIFPCVLVAWVFFRAESTGDAFTIFFKLFDITSPNFTAIKLALTVKGFAVCAAVVVAEFYVYLKEHKLVDMSSLSVFEPAGLAAIFAISIFFRGVGGDFIYFQF